MAFHRINTVDDPTINQPTNPNAHGSSNSRAINNSSNGSSNTNNSNSNNNILPGAPTINNASIQSVLSQDQNGVPDLLIDYQARAKQHQIHDIRFRNKLIDRLLTTLSTKNHPNALLIGEAGVGKTAVIEALAVRLYQHDPVVDAMLDPETKIYELPLTNLVSGSSLVGATEAKLQKVIEFISDPKNHAILYIDEIHQLTTNQELKNVAEMLKPALGRDDMRVIGSTTTQELKFWQRNPALTRRFSNLIVDELTDNQTIEILKDVLPKLQNRQHPVQVATDLLPQLVTVANHYAKSLATHRPDSAITILDQSLALARLQAIKIKQTTNTQATPKVTINTINQASQQLINSDQQTPNTQTLVNLKQQFDNNLIGQQTAKDKVCQAIQSLVLNLVPQTKPHSFLFAGPSGTGKTEIAKQLATVLFGGPDRFIYLNMTEYASDASLTRLIGSSKGYVGSESAQPLPLDSLKSNPSQIVLLDEFEKAGTDVQRIFMQALDEGSIQYADNSYVDFSHAIVIGTTNAGTDQLSTPHVGFDTQQTVSTSELTKALTKSFPPELLNRFEYLIPFDPISYNDYLQVLVLKYQQLRSQIQKQHPEYQLLPKVAKTDDDFIQQLAHESYDQLKNARPATRALQHFIESQFTTHPNSYTINLADS